MLSSKDIGLFIKKTREENQLTQEELAQRVYVTRQAISSWEKGLTFPSIDNVVSLCELFNCSIETLLCLKKGGEKHE